MECNLIKNGLKGSDPDFQSKYILLFDKNGTPIDSGHSDHEQMAVSFANTIGDMVKKYADVTGISYPADPDYFKKIGWTGLTGTAAEKYAPEGTSYTLAAEQGAPGKTALTQRIKCKL